MSGYDAIYESKGLTDEIAQLNQELARLRRGERELLEANNRYLFAGRAARQAIGEAHARLSAVLVSMLKAKEMRVLLDPTWFTEKVREVAQELQAGKPSDERFIGGGSCQMCHENAAELCRFCHPTQVLAVKDRGLPQPEAVMSGREGEIWEVRAYYNSREAADVAHAILAKGG